MPPPRASRGSRAASLLALLALPAFVAAVAQAPLRAQENKPETKPDVKPPGTRVDPQDPQGEVMDPRVQRMQGKTVRSVAFWE